MSAAADKAGLAVCTRHKWTWLRNVEIWRIGPRSGSMTLRGLYRCDCGQRKYGVCRHV